MSEVRVPDDVPWRSDGPVARVLALLNGNVARKPAWSGAPSATH